jgi:hypothetical protein
MTFTKTEKRTADYVRQGTTNLFAAVNTATGEALGRCCQRRRAKEFLTFMDQVVTIDNGREIHVVLDNLSTHSRTDVDTRLTKHPNVTVHLTPTGGSWLNQVETWFGIITKVRLIHQALQESARQQLKVKDIQLRDTSTLATTSNNQLERHPHRGHHSS